MTEPTLPADLNETEALTLLHTLAAADPDYPTIAPQLAPLALLSLPSDEQAAMAHAPLAVLGEDPHRVPALVAWLNPPPPQRFEASLLSAGLLVTVVFLLRTHIRFKRKSDGSWEFQIEHQPADSQRLTALLNKLSTLLPNG